MERLPQDHEEEGYRIPYKDSFLYIILGKTGDYKSLQLLCGKYYELDDCSFPTSAKVSNVRSALEQAKPKKWERNRIEGGSRAGENGNHQKVRGEVKRIFISDVNVSHREKWDWENEK